MPTSTLQSLIAADQDFEWYPTTERMIDAVAKRIRHDGGSLLDIGAGDGRVLAALATWREPRGEESRRKLYSIEKSAVLVQAQPEEVIPVGTDLFEQNLACIKVDFIFCNPPYSQYETWVSTIIESGYAQRAYLVIPQRWKDSPQIAASLKKRGAKAKVIHSDNFEDAERRARAVIDIIEVTYPKKYDRDYGRDDIKDPFDIWFDQNIDTFEREQELSEDQANSKEMARLRQLDTIGAMVDAYNEEYARMEANYRAIFQLDYALLNELGVKKDAVREGIKARMAGLKTKYWQLLFERLDAVTSRLSTKTKASFLERLTGIGGSAVEERDSGSRQTSVAFTHSNAYTVVLWAIKHANKYYDQQLVDLFRELSTFEGVQNYKSNQRTWEKNNWRYQAEDHSRYALDYRIVVSRYNALGGESFQWEHPGGLHKNCHELIDDAIAVFYNLGFTLGHSAPSRNRIWRSGEWQDFCRGDDSVLFQVKAFKNGNLHFRFMPDAIRVLNVEAGRLLGWLRSPADVVAELGYSADEAASFFGSSRKIGAGNIKLLTAAGAETATALRTQLDEGRAA